MRDEGQEGSVGSQGCLEQGAVSPGLGGGVSRLTPVLGNRASGLPGDLAGRTRVGPTSGKVFEPTGS